MIYLKQFNENKKLYQEVDMDEYYNISDNTNNTVVISKKTFKEIEKIFPGDLYITNRYVYPTNKEVMNNSKNPISSIVKITNDKRLWKDGINIEIVLDNDYWFWIFIESQNVSLYYKCDDIEGMIELFKTEFNF